MLGGVVGLTAIDVSLWGLVPSQSVLTFAPVWVGVVQIAVPLGVLGPFAQTVPFTGAGAWFTLWRKSIGWPKSPSSASAPLAPRVSARVAAPATSRLARRRGGRWDPVMAVPFGAHARKGC